jgi:hypothetical protein
MPSPAPAAPTLSLRAFLMLLLLAWMFGGNHVAARLAFNDGVDVATAVTLRSGVTALVVGLLVWQQRVSWAMSVRQRVVLGGVSVLVAVQSLALYASVARLPVALALLAFNTWPMWTALWARVLYGTSPDRRTVLAMPVILVGLALALDVFGAASGLGAQAQWLQIGAGVGFALLAAATFGVVMVVTQHEIAPSTAGCAVRSRWRWSGCWRWSSPSTRAAAAAAQQPGLVGAGDADAAVRHRLHDHVHAAAAAGRGRLVADHERRTGGRDDPGLGAAGRSASPPCRCWAGR